MTHSDRKAQNHRGKPGTLRKKTAILALATIAPLMVLQGCANVSKRHFVVGSTPDHYEKRHAIELSEREQTLDMPIASSSYGISAPNASAIEGFARAYKRSANGTFTIMLPQGSPNEQAAANVSPQIVDIVSNVGVPRHRISTVSYYAGEHGTAAPIRLSFGAVRAEVGECGKWDTDLGNHTENRNYSNFGCASQKNLAAIIANPADLIAPRGQSPLDAARRADVIDKYRKGEETLTPPREFTTMPEPVWD
ncbi:CpaD family pilus assembly protein [Pseudahrensia aquimaris]|uniref:CpaD family pilus assembly protein n=1 Tax=Pseudahrensia aquimaris TaxID=744461 RepID=A0ABW3FHT6_9HYPH